MLDVSCAVRGEAMSPPDPGDQRSMHLGRLSHETTAPTLLDYLEQGGILLSGRPHPETV